MQQRRIVLGNTTLILIMGVPASGKTTLAKEILKRINAVYLDNNFLADAFFASTRKAPSYRRLRQGLYRALYRITEENLLVRNSVLLDVPHVTHMRDPEWRDFLVDIARRTSAELAIVRCLCSESTLRERIQNRGEGRDQWKLHNWAKFMAQEPIDVQVPLPHLDLDTEEDFASNVARAVRYIRQASSAERLPGTP
jgi:predicted kinase